MKQSPTTTVLVDEAYFEYGTMPGYETMIPLAVAEPARGRRPHLLEVLRHGRHPHRLRDRPQGHDREDGATGTAIGNISVHGAPGRQGGARVPDAWVRTSRSATPRLAASPRSGSRIAATRRPTRSPTSCSSTSSGRPASFREACLKEGVLVGRDFPPYEKTHVRISVGTMEEMQKAVQVFEHALAQPAKAAA